MKQGEAEANAVLSVDPSSQDAYVALGMANYVIGFVAGSYKRAFLWFGGVRVWRQGKGNGTNVDRR